MDQKSDIDTIQMGYEETAVTSQQPHISHTQKSRQNEHSEVQDALTLASMLQQLRTQTLSGERSARGDTLHA